MEPRLAQDSLRAELTAGERILWTGSPDPSTRFSPADRVLIPISAFWIAMVIGMIVLASSTNAPGPFPIVLVLFLIVGCFTFFGRFAVKARRKRRTVYAVTDRRVLIVEQRPGGNRVQSAFLSSLPGLHLREGPRGVGTITFGNASMYSNMMANTGLESFNWMYPIPMAFYDVAQARSVHDLIVKARAAAPG